VGSPEVSVILPTYQERESLELLAPLLAHALAGYAAEVVVVDDASPDGTADYAASRSGALPWKVVRRARRLGLASAVLDGIAASTSPVIVVMDADGSHPPDTLPALIDTVRQGGAELALASRRASGASMTGFVGLRKMVSSVAGALARPLTKVSDPMTGYFAMRRSILGRSPLTPVGYKIGLEILVKCRPRPVVEIPFHFGPRMAGESKLDRREIGSYLQHLWRLYWWRLVSTGRTSRTR